MADMSAMSAAQIREPEGLFEPDFQDARVDEIAENLSPDGSREFFRQIFQAVAQSRREGDLRYLNEVLESWYRTMIFVSTPGFREKIDLARTDPGPRLTVKDIRNRRAALS